MEIYERARLYMMITGIANIGFSIIGLTIFFIYRPQLYNLTSELIKSLGQVLLIQTIVGVVVLALFGVVVYYCYKIGVEVENGFLIWGGVVYLIASLASTIFNFFMYREIINTFYLIQEGIITNEILKQLIRILVVSSILGIFDIIGKIIFGIGVRKLGDILGSDGLKTGGLLIILGFIPLLFPIGLVVSGYELKKLV